MYIYIIFRNNQLSGSERSAVHVPLAAGPGHCSFTQMLRDLPWLVKRLQTHVVSSIPQLTTCCIRLIYLMWYRISY